MLHAGTEIIFDLNNSDYLLCGGITVATWLAGTAAYSSLKSKVNSKMAMQEKIAKIQSATVIRYATMEGGALLIFFAIQTNPSFFLFCLH